MKKLFLQNLSLKLLSLFLALILFVLVREDRVKEFDIDVPVVTDHMPENFVFVGELPTTIRISLRGRWSKILDAIERRHTPFVIDMRTVKDGDVVFFDAVGLKPIVGEHGPAIVAVTPNSATIRLVARVRKGVRVRPDLIGEPGRGYLLKRDAVLTTPQEVTVRGPADSVREIEELLTAPINIEGLDRDLILERVSVRQPALPYVTMERDQVRVEVTVEEVSSSRLLAAVPVEVRGCRPMRACEIAPRTVPVQLLGPMLTLERIDTGGGVGLLWVDASDISAAGGVFGDIPIRTSPLSRVVVTPTTQRATVTVTELQPAVPPVVRDLIPIDAGAPPGASDAGPTETAAPDASPSAVPGAGDATETAPEERGD